MYGTRLKSWMYMYTYPCTRCRLQLPSLKATAAWQAAVAGSGGGRLLFQSLLPGPAHPSTCLHVMFVETHLQHHHAIPCGHDNVVLPPPPRLDIPPRSPPAGADKLCGMRALGGAAPSTAQLHVCVAF